MGDFYGLPTGLIATRHLQLEYLTEAGPRLVRLLLKAAAHPENILAETPLLSWPTPFGDYHLRGGHRLWHAPEAAGQSSMPDSDGLEAAELADGVRLCQPVESATGIRKILEVHVPSDRPALTLTHVLINEGVRPVELAPWAITQLALGGVAILPQPSSAVDPHGLQPNRSLVLWPYTHVADERLELHDDVWLVHGRSQLQPCKIGYLDRQGWAGYFWNQTLLMTRFGRVLDRQYPDWGCNVEVYCNDGFLELETLAPLDRLEPGQSATHVEQWEFLVGVDVPPSWEGIRSLMSRVPPEWLAPLSDDELSDAGQGWKQGTKD